VLGRDFHGTRKQLSGRFIQLGLFSTMHANNDENPAYTKHEPKGRSTNCSLDLFFEIIHHPTDQNEGKKRKR
jgi:hypothetical protein